MLRRRRQSGPAGAEWDADGGQQGGDDRHELGRVLHHRDTGRRPSRALGEVRGVWDNSVDSYGDYMGPDTLYLHDAKGTFILTFNDENAAGGHPLGHGAVDFVHTQRLYQGKGAYASATESGTIQLDTNNAKSLIVSLTLESQNS